jgi:hypothetical protein
MNISCYWWRFGAESPSRLLLSIATIISTIIVALHIFGILNCTYVNCCLSVNCAGQESTLIHMVLFFRFTAESWIKF